MIVAVNARLLKKRRLEGIGNFMDEVLRRVVQSHPEIQFHFIFDHKPDLSFKYGNNVTLHVLFPPTKHVLLYNYWFNKRLPKVVKKINADLFLSLDSLGSIKLDIPQHLVLHDINFEHRPQDLPKSLAKFYQKNTRLLLQKTARIATVSQYSKADIARTYQYPSEQIDVVYNAAKELFKPIAPEEQEIIRARYTKGKPYFFYVGSLHPRKNLLSLLRAFETFKQSDDKETLLLIAGDVMWSYPEFKKQMNAMRHQKSVVLLGRIPDKRLAELMACSIALTYIPYFEGFGIPIVEAYASGVPVITSDQTCLPEIAGKGALFAHPDDLEGIADQMRLLSRDETLRNELIAAGSAELMKYSWDKTAALYWESVLKTMSQQ